MIEEGMILMNGLLHLWLKSCKIKMQEQHEFGTEVNSVEWYVKNESNFASIAVMW